MTIPTPSIFVEKKADWALVAGSPGTETDEWGNVQHIFDGIDDLCTSVATSDHASSDVYSQSWWADFKDDLNSNPVLTDVLTQGVTSHTQAEATRFHFQITDPIVGDKRVSKIDTAIFDGQLHHWFYTANGTTDTFKVYRDGVLVAFTSDADAGSGFDAFGASYNSGIEIGANYDGRFLRFKDYNEEVSAVDVIDEFNNELALRLDGEDAQGGLGRTSFRLTPLRQPRWNRGKRRFLKGSLVKDGATDAQDFVFVIKTNNTGSSNDDQFLLTLHAAETYNCTISWGDGDVQSITSSSDVTHTYSVEGTYTIHIRGVFAGIKFADTGDKLKLLEVSNWGDSSWQSLSSAFHGCVNCSFTATDIPDVSSVTNASSAFNSAILFNQNTSLWDMLNVTNGASMHSGGTAHNQPMDVQFSSSLAAMQNILRDATSFDQSLGALVITGATSLTNMLLGATLSTTNYNDTLVGFEGQTEPINLNFHGGNSTHSGAGTTARGVLVATSGWTITDGGAA